MEIYSNEYRKYLGIKPLKDNYKCEIYEDGCIKILVYFDKDKIVKIINIYITDKYFSLEEKDVDYDTTNNHKIILPKTNRGKPKKITFSVIENLSGYGTYFYISKPKDKEGYYIIGNYTTQKTFLKEYFDDKISDLDSLIEWLNNYINDLTADDLEELNLFINEKRKHINYKEGDYFRIKVGKHNYTYGRILMDVYKRTKKGFKYWNIFMGRPLIIEIFHILTEDKNVSIDKLKTLPTYPSQHIMDNNIYYGDYQIIGHDELPKNIKYPIMYGKSISGIDPNKIIFQCGEVYKEIEYNNNLIKNNNESRYNDADFRNHSIGYNIDLDKKILKETYLDKDNSNYWKFNIYQSNTDLRSPKNKDYLKQVLQQMDLEYLYDLYKDC